MAALAVPNHAAAAPQEIFSRTTANGETWQLYTVAFSPTQSANYTLGFNITATDGAIAGHDDHSIYLDDVRVTSASGVSGDTFKSGFESPVVSAQQVYPNGTFGDWVFTNYSGVIPGSPSQWGPVGPKEGNQRGFVQAYFGTLSNIKTATTFHLNAGQTYTVTYWQASRSGPIGNEGVLTYTVTMDKVPTPPSLTWIDSSQVALNGNFGSYTNGQPWYPQYQTGDVLHYSGTLPGWTTSGVHAVHSVDLTGSGDYVVQIWQDNVLTSPSFSSGNTAGTDYVVSCVAGPAVQADPTQVTTANDGLVFTLLRSDGTTLASYVYHPGAWQGVNALVPVSFHYTGDGSGPVQLQISPYLFNDGHFGGELGDLVVAPASAYNPSTITVTATSAAGAVENYYTSSYDFMDGDKTVTSSNPSGSTFGMGSTHVTLSAQNSAGKTVSGTFTVNVVQATAQIDFATPSYTYNGLGQPAIVSTVPANLPVTLTYDGGSSAAPVSAGTHTVAASVSQNWIVGSASGTVSIAQATATIVVTPYSVTYDGAPHTASGTAKNAGGTILGGLVLAGTTHTNAGTYTGDAWSFTDPTGNYASATGTVNNAIAQATATIVVTPYSVTYDGASHTASGTAKNTGGTILGGLVLAGTTHTNAGTYTGDSWTFTDPTGNYASATGTVNDAIAQATATVVVAPYSVTYDGAPHTASGTAKNAGGTILGGLVLSGTTHTNAGTYTGDSWTFHDPSGNFADQSGTVNDKIGQAAPTLSWLPPAAIAYGTPLGATQLDATANVPGTFSYAPWAGVVLGVGNAQVLTAAFTPTDSTNYTPGTVTTAIDVLPAGSPIITVPPTITATAPGAGGAVVNYSASATDQLGIPVFSDGFETPVIAANSYFVPTGGPGGPPATFGNWVFSSTAGVINGPSAAWGSTAVPYTGNQFIWLQDENFSGIGQGSVQSVQSVSLVAGQSYTVWWAQASRANNGGVLTYAVSIVGNQGTTQLFSRTTSEGESWNLYNTTFTAANSGPVTIEFSVISPPNVDNSIFLDAVSMTTTGPVPATLAPPSGSTFQVGPSTVTASATNYAGNSSSQTFTVTVTEPVTFTVSPVSFTYNGNPQGPIVTPSDPNAAFTVSGTTSATQAGGYTLTATATGNYTGSTGAVAWSIAPAASAISVSGGTSFTYNGSAQGPSTVTETGSTGARSLSYVGTGTTSYGPSATAPTNAGAYSVTATVAADSNYQVATSAPFTFTITKANPVLTWPTPAPITYGTLLSTTQLDATCNVLGSFVYVPAVGTKLNVGAGQTLIANFTPTDTVDYNTGIVTTKITVNPADATVILANLNQIYDGTPRIVTVTTGPVTGLSVTVVYTGTYGTVYGPSSTPPIGVGSYTVVATINDPNYQGSGAGIFVVSGYALVKDKLSINGEGGIYGSVQVGAIFGSGQVPTEDHKEDEPKVNVTGDGYVSSSLFVEGMPELKTDGQGAIGTIKIGSGLTTPTNYEVDVNGHALVGTLVTRTNPATMPVVNAPPKPLGTQDVHVTGNIPATINFATLRNLTVDGKSSTVTVPAGTYGDFTVNGGGDGENNGGTNGNSTLIFGVPGSTAPSVYNLQNLKIDTQCAIKVVGPVVIVVANDLEIHGVIGSAAHPEWLTLKVADDDVHFDSQAAVYGSVVAPVAQVSLSGNSEIIGNVTCDELDISGNGFVGGAMPLPTFEIETPAANATYTIPYGSATTADVSCQIDVGVAGSEVIASALAKVDGAPATLKVDGLNSNSVNVHGDLHLGAGVHALVVTATTGDGMTSSSATTFTVAKSTKH